jgi:hypothetical protein
MPAADPVSFIPFLSNDLMLFGTFTGLGVWAFRSLWQWFRETWWPHHVELVKAEEARKDKLFLSVENLQTIIISQSKLLISLSEDIHQSLKKVMQALFVNSTLDSKTYITHEDLPCKPLNSSNISNL